MLTAGRLDRLRDSLETEALAVTSLTNIRYLTGFTGSAGLLLVLPGATSLVTDGRYETQAGEELATAGVAVEVEVAPAVRQREVISSRLCAAGVTVLGLEAVHLSWARQRQLAEWLQGVELVPVVGAVEELRRFKDAGELARMASAAAIADRSLASVLSRLAESPTEIDFALALDTEMRAFGAGGPAFETICASGPNAAKPHHRPSPRRIGAGEAVVVDFGAMVDGYCSDMTRTVHMGKATNQAWDVYHSVLEAQEAAVAAVAPGVRCGEVDEAARSVLRRAGLEKEFLHSTGHGVGLEIHEGPRIAAKQDQLLEQGMVITIEPGAYLSDRSRVGAGTSKARGRNAATPKAAKALFGVRIEDMVLVTATGGAVLTSASPKGWIEL